MDLKGLYNYFKLLLIKVYYQTVKQVLNLKIKAITAAFCDVWPVMAIYRQLLQDRSTHYNR